MPRCGGPTSRRSARSSSSWTPGEPVIEFRAPQRRPRGRGGRPRVARRRRVRRLRDGYCRRTSYPPLPRAARAARRHFVGCSASQPSTPCSSSATRATRLATNELGVGRRRPARLRAARLLALDRGVPRWRWQVGDVVLEGVAMTHGARWGSCTDLSAPTVRSRADAAARGEARTASDGARRPRGSRRPRTASSSRAHTVSQGPAGDPAVAYRGVRTGGGGARAERPRGLRPRLLLRRAGERHEATAAAEPFDGVLPGAAAIVTGARERGAAVVRQAPASGRCRRAARARGRPVRDRSRRPDCRRGLSVVRRVVARPPMT